MNNIHLELLEPPIGLTSLPLGPAIPTTISTTAPTGTPTPVPSLEPGLPPDLVLEARMLRQLHPNLTDAELIRALDRVGAIAAAALAADRAGNDPKDRLTRALHRIGELHAGCPVPLSLGQAVALDQSLRAAKARDRIEKANRDQKPDPNKKPQKDKKSDWDEECDAVLDSLLDWYGPDILLEDLDHLDRWFAEFTRNRNYTSSKRARYLLSRFYRAMRDTGQCPWDLAKTIALPPPSQKAGGRRRGREVTILTPREVRRLLWAAMCERPDIIPLLVLMLFAGLRPKREAMEVEFGEDPNSVHLSADIVKTRRSRDVTINEVIQAWWAFYPQAGKVAGSFTYCNARNILRRLMRKVGIKLAANVLRHTFCSVTLALANDSTVENQEAGHGLIAQRRYRKRMAPGEGLAYRDILPPPGWQPVIPFIARRAAGKGHPSDEAMIVPLAPEIIAQFLKPTTPGNLI